MYAAGQVYLNKTWW